MKILHVWFTAGIPMIISKYQRKSGHKSNVILREKLDTMQFNQYYKELSILTKGYKRFVLSTILQARKYEVIHIHGFAYPLVRYLRWFYKKKKIVLTFHGTEVRGKWAQRKKIMGKADLVTVATEDLLEGAPEGVIYVKNPVDMELFGRKNKYHEKTALFIYCGEKPEQDLSLEVARKEAEKRGLQLAVQYRSEWSIPNKLFPRFLELFEYLIDVKQNKYTGEIINSSSATCLQMLALGGKVIYGGEEIEQFPEEHDPSKIAQKWVKLYEQIE
jgi:hypothetical protein